MAPAPGKPRASELVLYPAFRGEDPRNLEWVVERCRWVRLAPGETLISPHRNQDTLFIVDHGRLQIRLGGPNGQILANLGSGQCVGEISVIEGITPAAEAVAVGHCRLLALPGETVRLLLEHSHTVTRNLLYILSARLRTDNHAVSHTLERQRVYEQHANFDELTGLHNRRALNVTLQRLVERPEPGPVSVIMLDVDHFKEYNDAYGHLAGDRALQAVAKALADNIRPGDMAARYGGDEFMVLMPAAGSEAALAAGERLRRAVSGEIIPGDNHTSLPSLHVSVGVTTIDGDARSMGQLLEQADRALYAAKRGGRDRVSQPLSQDVESSSHSV